MNRISSVSASLLLAVLMIPVTLAFGEELKSIQLPKPQLDIGRPLMQVLKDRSSSRSFSTEKLPVQVLSNLLWAAFGINRPDTGHRTAPSARNWQEIDIYVAMADGLYLYDAKNHMLQPVISGDIRAMAGTQDFVKDAPINLIYVADFSKTGNATKDDKEMYSAADTGFISQNVYLFCSSEGLATVVRGSINREALAKAMKLRPDQKIILAQTIGYTKK
ncbi:MAG TPA: SagB/ThcOx family dehydrogenase [Thermodesulfovibrionales bacterium]|nr:SagB/ThcOx family dehydrogenase [Thermodesulfovibrionales bacterium]